MKVKSPNLHQLERNHSHADTQSAPNQHSVSTQLRTKDSVASSLLMIRPESGVCYPGPQLEVFQEVWGGGAWLNRNTEKALLRKEARVKPAEVTPVM